MKTRMAITAIGAIMALALGQWAAADGLLRHRDVGNQITKQEWEASDVHYIDGGTTGDLIYGAKDSALRTNLKRLAIGTSDTILISNGNVPSWGRADVLTGSHARLHAITGTSDHSATANRLLITDAAGHVAELSGTSGTVPTFQGTGAPPIAQGIPNSHERSHAITSTSDHSAGNDKIFYSDGSGHVQEVGLGTTGTVLKSHGTGKAPIFEGGGLTQGEADGQYGRLDGTNMPFTGTVGTSQSLIVDGNMFFSGRANASPHGFCIYGNQGDAPSLPYIAWGPDQTDSVWEIDCGGANGYLHVKGDIESTGKIAGDGSLLTNVAAATATTATGAVGALHAINATQAANASTLDSIDSTGFVKQSDQGALHSTAENYYAITALGLQRNESLIPAFFGLGPEGLRSADLGGSSDGWSFYKPLDFPNCHKITKIQVMHYCDGSPATLKVAIKEQVCDGTCIVYSGDSATLGEAGWGTTIITLDVPVIMDRTANSYMLWIKGQGTFTKINVCTFWIVYQD